MVNCGIFAFSFEASASSVTDVDQYPTSGYAVDSNAPTTGSVGMIYTYCPDLSQQYLFVPDGSKQFTCCHRDLALVAEL